MAAMQTLAYDSLRKNLEKVEVTLSKTLEKRRNVMFIL